MSDALSHGTRFRTFSIIDDDNREVLAIEVDTSLGAGHSGTGSSKDTPSITAHDSSR